MLKFNTDGCCYFARVIGEEPELPAYLSQTDFSQFVAAPAPAQFASGSTAHSALPTPRPISFSALVSPPDSSEEFLLQNPHPESSSSLLSPQAPPTLNGTLSAAVPDPADTEEDMPAHTQVALPVRTALLPVCRRDALLGARLSARAAGHACRHASRGAAGVERGMRCWRCSTGRSRGSRYTGSAGSLQDRVHRLLVGDIVCIVAVAGCCGRGLRLHGWRRRRGGMPCFRRFALIGSQVWIAENSGLIWANSVRNAGSVDCVMQ
jgi:hypothetical protein